jgi:hypothetical protein
MILPSESGNAGEEWIIFDLLQIEVASETQSTAEEGILSRLCLVWEKRFMYVFDLIRTMSQAFESEGRLELSVRMESRETIIACEAMEQYHIV